MLISLDWIRDFTEVPQDLSAQDIGLRVTMGTAEVEEVISLGQFWKQIKVVEITHIEPHPEADKLNLVTFKLNDEESFRVVCGAGNVRVGLRTPFAPIGTTLPVGFTLEPKKIRGILSEGMLCSEEELGLAESSKGIMELPQDAPLGLSLKQYWEKNEDTLFDIDNKSLTHRPDLWGHYGMAREFAALYDQELKKPFNESWSSSLEKDFNDEAAPIKVVVEKESCGLAYFGLSLDNISVGESPQFIKDRLTAVGLRPINNIVDISNYVMIELGMPLHIFDRNKIEGDTLTIKLTGSEQTFVTLDEVERKLTVNDTVIADAQKPLVIAGIMGGLNSGVTAETKNIFIEVANWKSDAVRKTSTRLGLRTDSSMRYEKTLDSRLCYRTLLRTFEMLKEQCPELKVRGGVQYDGEDLSEYNPLLINTSTEEICSTLGKELSTKRVVDLLESLAFKVQKKDSGLTIEVPSFRATKDIECSADIIEEVGRIIGYDNIEPVGPLLDVSPVRLSPIMTMKRKAQDYLSLHAGSLEVNTYPMIGEKLLDKASWLNKINDLKVINSLSVDQDRMRDSLIPSFLEAAALNSKNKDSFRFFELGRTYHHNPDSFASEKHILGICFFSKEKTPFMDLINEVKNLNSYLNIPYDLSGAHPKFKNNLVDENWVGIHPQEFLNMRVMGQMNGALLSIHPLILKKFKIKGHLSVALIDLTAATAKPLKEKTSYKPLSKYPESRFDFTVALGLEQSVAEVLDVLKKVKIKDMKEVLVVDIYTPEKGEKAQKFVTMRTIFHNEQQTLPGEDIKKYEEMIINTLSKAGIHLKS
jgi:phenylalanyl-tRNA synthetase beta chain